MCILSRPIKDIASTNIFVNDLGDDVHGTVYSMEIATDVPVAMLLPVPVRQADDEDALTFVDLSEYPDFFKDMGKLFPEPMSRGFGVAARGLKSLQVHQVGAFKASYVPAPLSNFLRLDTQFRLDPSVWASLPNYDGFGYAVFQFDPGAKKEIHPMAYKYPANTLTELFFPTVHVHDGHHADRNAHFDHQLYYQQSGNFGDANGWTASEHIPDWSMKVGRTGGLVRNTDPLYRRRMRGMLLNADQILVNNGTFVQHVERPARVA